MNSSSSTSRQRAASGPPSPPPGRIRTGICEDRHVFVTHGPGGFIERHPPHLAEVSGTGRLFDVPLAQRDDPADRLPADARCPGKRRLTREQQHERPEQQREVGELAAPGQGDLHDLAAKQFHLWHSHLKLALVLEEAQVPVGLGERAVHRMLPGLSRHPNAAVELEAHPNAELALPGLKFLPAMN